MAEFYKKRHLDQPIECWGCGKEATDITEWGPNEESNGVSRMLCEVCDTDLYMDQLGGDMAVFTTAPTRPPAATSSYTPPGHVAKVVSKKCMTGHLFTITFGEDRGNLILASYRGGARIADGVDMGLFFYKDWGKTAGKSPVELIPGSDGKVGPDLFEEGDYTIPPFIMLDWKDYGAPPPVAYDYAKWAAVRMNEHNETIQVGCMGGHGRTGTFAAYVLMTTSNKTPEEAIDWVHEKYCADAIEGKDQVESIWEYHDWLHGVKLNEGAEA